MRWSIIKNQTYVTPMNGGRMSMLKYNKMTNYYLEPREPNGLDTLLKVMATAYTGQTLRRLLSNVILFLTRKKNPEHLLYYLPMITITLCPKMTNLYNKNAFWHHIYDHMTCFISQLMKAGLKK